MTVLSMSKASTFCRPKLVPHNTTADTVPSQTPSANQQHIVLMSNCSLSTTAHTSSCTPGAPILLHPLECRRQAAQTTAPCSRLSSEVDAGRTVILVLPHNLQVNTLLDKHVPNDVIVCSILHAGASCIVGSVMTHVVQAVGVPWDVVADQVCGVDLPRLLGPLSPAALLGLCSVAGTMCVPAGAACCCSMQRTCGATDCLPRCAQLSCCSSCTSWCG